MVREHRLKEAGQGSLYPSLQKHRSDSTGPPTKPCPSKFLSSLRSVALTTNIEQIDHWRTSKVHQNISERCLCLVSTLHDVESLGKAVCVGEGRRRARAKRDAHLGPGSCVQNVRERKRLHRHGCRNVEKPVKGWDVGEKHSMPREKPLLYAELNLLLNQWMQRRFGVISKQLSLCVWRFTARNCSYRELLLQ